MGARVKHHILRSAAACLYYSGVLGMFCRLKDEPFAVIVNYHNIKKPVTPEETSLPAMYVHPDTFEVHVRYLARHYHVVSMRELMTQQARGHRSSKPWCAITFDDGWSDNYYHALPILRKYDLPATVFISTGFIGSKRTPWFYEVLRCVPVLSDRIEEGRLSAQDFAQQGITGVFHRWANLPGPERIKTVDRMMEEMKAFPGAALDDLVDRLQQMVVELGGNTEAGDPVMLNWEQVREMNKSKIEIGSHGVKHWILTHLSPDQLQGELEDSKRVIE